jgi:23S rRNA (guanosine2251-2'-O)-methyltransferase
MVLSKRRAPPLSPAVARASAGAIEWLPVARVTNLARAIQYLKSEGFWVVGADPSATESLYEVPDRVLQGDLAVVLGAEGRGLRPEVRKLVDHPVRIEMRGQVASLNVSAAGAVLLYELLRRADLDPSQVPPSNSSP